MDDTAPVIPTLMSVEGAATRLGISRTVMYGEVAAGRVPHGMIGRRIMLTERDLLDYLEAVRQVGPVERRVDARTG